MKHAIYMVLQKDQAIGISFTWLQKGAQGSVICAPGEPWHLIWGRKPLNMAV